MYENLWEESLPEEVTICDDDYAAGCDACSVEISGAFYYRDGRDTSADICRACGERSGTIRQLMERHKIVEPLVLM